ncbi:MAG: DUF2064 domain-containing protein [Bacteroidota bacterium]
MENLHHTDTAVLVFANSAHEDVSLKQLGPNQHLFEALTEHTLKLVKATGLAYFVFTEKEQKGATFGERFSNAIQQVFFKGYTKVITLGNDSPLLTSNHILIATTQLSEQHCILGPSTDGGFYLMGIHRNNFNLKSFAILPWQKNSLYQAAQCYFKANNCVVLALDRLSDIDSITDVKHFLNHIKTLGRKWIVLFSKVFQHCHRFFKIRFLSSQSIYRSACFNKGSPFHFAQSII